MTPSPTALPSLHDLVSLKNHRAVVTGGAQGIGQAIALRLADAGCHVVVVDVDQEALQATLTLIEQRGVKALGIVGDVALPATAHKAIDACCQTFGGIDVLVNNAGVFPSVPLLEVSEGLWDKVLDVNLKGAFFFAQCAARRMIERGRGSIVQIASIDAVRPSGNLTAYDASKGGMLMLTRSLAKELGVSGVRVNTICPGGVSTPGVASAVSAMAAGLNMTTEALLANVSTKTPLGRMGEPDDIARAALFFASPLSSWVTGAVLVVDGGALLG